VEGSDVKSLLLSVLKLRGWSDAPFFSKLRIQGCQHRVGTENCGREWRQVVVAKCQGRKDGVGAEDGGGKWCESVVVECQVRQHRVGAEDSGWKWCQVVVIKRPGRRVKIVNIALELKMLEASDTK
jgi:hypothetical protein